MKAEYVGNGTVDAGKLAHHFKGFTPTGPQPAELDGNAQGQQAAGTQGIALCDWRTTALVTFDCAVSEFAGQLPGSLQR